MRIYKRLGSRQALSFITSWGPVKYCLFSFSMPRLVFVRINCLHSPKSLLSQWRKCFQPVTVIVNNSNVTLFHKIKLGLVPLSLPFGENLSNKLSQFQNSESRVDIVTNRKDYCNRDCEAI